jgi:hypothetical protein
VDGAAEKHRKITEKCRKNNGKCRNYLKVQNDGKMTENDGVTEKMEKCQEVGMFSRRGEDLASALMLHPRCRNRGVFYFGVRKIKGTEKGSAEKRKYGGVGKCGKCGNAEMRRCGKKRKKRKSGKGGNVLSVSG